MRTLDPAATVAAAREGDRRALGRLITAVEERAEAAVEIGRLTARSTGHAHVVGITGPPGVGKSTTTAALVKVWRELGLTVAVIAVDPSSPFTGGALLGDRVRMNEHSTDPGVFIRSMAARGQMGGLAAATPAAVRVLDACGFDVVVIETVGVGQSEIDVVRYADTVVILQAPGMGDRIQASKAGLLEIGDVFGVNKADRPGGNAAFREIRSMIASKAAGVTDWRSEVVSLVATDGTGVADLASAIEAHRLFALESGALLQRRRERISSEIVGLAAERLGRALTREQATLGELADDVENGWADPYAAAATLLRRVDLSREDR